MITLVCPDCGTNLTPIDQENNLACEKCNLIYPTKEQIYIILAKPIRNVNLEYPLLKALEKKSQLPEKIKAYIQNTLKIIEGFKGIETWEWQDQKFFNQKYLEMSKLPVEVIGNDRLWQNSTITKALLDHTTLQGKTLLDIGSGESHVFTHLFAKECNNKTLYIAVDMSFNALLLCRKRNPHKNSIYILASADYQLPFPKKSIDLLCYFGILHHTKNKAANIEKDKLLLRNNGFLILCEALQRTVLIEGKEAQSAHEETINRSTLYNQVQNENLIFRREHESPVYFAVMSTFGRTILNSKKLYLFLLTLDSLLCLSVGKAVTILGAGEVQLLVQLKK
jgi:ubiquinone/menaquinone biosynthesis C-methylase UbiE/uncharacterized protein YbaR (Trm112 family)